MTDQPVAVTIYHNPACGTSRNALALIRNAGIQPTVVEYLKTPPDRATLKDLIAFAGNMGQGVDRTGLTGVYDFTLSWNEEEGPSLASALRDQLGLQVKPEKVPVARFVLDSAQKPTPN